jgi:DNA-binding CsgD family transcriptional regulator
MKEVGNILNLTPRTVAFHKYRIRRILNAHSDADLVRYALRKKVLLT